MIELTINIIKEMNKMIINIKTLSIVVAFSMVGIMHNASTCPSKGAVIANLIKFINTPDSQTSWNFSENGTNYIIKFSNTRKGTARKRGNTLNQMMKKMSKNLQKISRGGGKKRHICFLSSGGFNINKYILIYKLKKPHRHHRKKVWGW